MISYFFNFKLGQFKSRLQYRNSGNTTLEEFDGVSVQGCKTLNSLIFLITIIIIQKHLAIPVLSQQQQQGLQVFLKVALKSLPFLVSKTNEVDVFNGMSIFPSEALQDSSDFSSSWNLDERNLHQGIQKDEKFHLEVVKNNFGKGNLQSYITLV